MNATWFRVSLVAFALSCLGVVAWCWFGWTPARYLTVVGACACLAVAICAPKPKEVSG